MSTTYTYSIYDSHPQLTGAYPWPSHTRVPCNSVEEADEALVSLANECADLPDYPPGSEIYAQVFTETGRLVCVMSCEVG